MLVGKAKHHLIFEVLDADSCLVAALGICVAFKKRPSVCVEKGALAGQKCIWLAKQSLFELVLDDVAETAFDVFVLLVGFNKSELAAPVHLLLVLRLLLWMRQLLESPVELLVLRGKLAGVADPTQRLITVLTEGLAEANVPFGLHVGGLELLEGTEDSLMSDELLLEIQSYVELRAGLVVLFVQQVPVVDSSYLRGVLLKKLFVHLLYRELLRLAQRVGPSHRVMLVDRLGLTIQRVDRHLALEHLLLGNLEGVV